MTDIFQGLPKNITVTYTRNCECGRNKTKEKRTQELIIEPNFHYGMNNEEYRTWYIYYEGSKNVGVFLGKGYPLEECIEKVKEKLKEGPFEFEINFI